MPVPKPKCNGKTFCYHMAKSLSGRNKQGFVIGASGCVYFKPSWAGGAKRVHYCPFCGKALPGAERKGPYEIERRPK